jgi:hypothetical protein
MASPHNLGGNYWGYLINQQNKSATPLLTQLCEGLAKIIVGYCLQSTIEDDADSSQSQLDPGPDTGLTPQRLSTYYKSVGGNDFVFRELGYPGLSLMYRTLGCFHSLQPTANAFDAPSVPCLLPLGFVRWQTLQLLLYPDEHAQCMQKAVALYDIPKPAGGNFPKTIPRESFPLKPDEAMEKWHNIVLERLDEGNHRLKNSPYCSPYESGERGEGYFPRNSPHMRRTSRPPRTENQDPPHRSSPTSRRRSSVPTIPSPIVPPEHLDNHHWSSDQAYSAPNSAVPRSPRHRPSNSTASPRPLSQQYPRASNSHNTNHTNVASTNNTSAKSFNLNFDNFHIPFISSPFNSKKKQHRERSSTSAAPRARPRSPGRSEAVSTGSEASSEDSLPRIPKYERDRRRSALAPADYNGYKRRHSHDATYLPSPKYMSAFPTQPPRTHVDHSHNNHTYVPQTAPIPGLFREDLSSNGHGASSAPESPNGAPNNPRLRVTDPTGRDQSGERGRERRFNSGETLQERRAVSAERRSRSDDRRGIRNADRNRLNMRGEGTPLRVNTVAGTGRRVRNPEVRSAGVPGLRRAPPTGLSGGGRR